MKHFTLFLLGIFMYSGIMSQEFSDKLNPDLLESTWSAHWIFHPTASGTGYGVYHFRKTFHLDNIPERFIIHVSADNRYRLFVNGKPVCFGPARGDILNWRYETIDIAPLLHAGNNLLASVVWNFGEYRPLAQFSYRTGFIVQGDMERERTVDTDGSWKVTRNEAYQPVPVDGTMVNGYYVAGPGDHVDGKYYPWGWELPDYDDSEWLEPGMIQNPGVPRGLYDYAGQSGWNLIPRNIPAMEETGIRFDGLVRASESGISEGFLNGMKNLIIPANHRVDFLLDQKNLTISYPELLVSQGKGSRIKIRYAEALVDENGKKGNRNIIEGKTLKGYYDIFEPDGGKSRLFRPLWYRTYRYVKLEITTQNQPLIIHDCHGVFTAYPFRRTAEFSCPEPMLSNIWDICWRTARLCATETYYDCPYYEQLQYVGDTRIQALISLYMTGDDRLMKNAIIQFDHSRIPDGITTSRYPSYFPQMTPPYSLIWILMVHDYYMLRPDDGFTGQFMFGIDNVIHWFREKLDHTGLLGKLEWANYMDAAPGFGPAGSPPNAENGHSAQITLLFAYALDHAAELADHHKMELRAMEYRSLAASLKKKVYNLCYDPEKKLFSETPEKKAWTQHTNILAVLTDAIPANEQKDMVQRILDDTTLIPAQIYFRFYLAQAMKKAGLADLYLEHLEPWESMINQGLTTFAEHSLEGRSDCHAWSAHPCYDFLATVCGIEPARPGFASVRIEPHPGRLNKIHGTIPHPLGMIEVDLEKKGKNGIEGKINLPENLNGKFYWRGNVAVLKGGEQMINFE